MDLNMERKACEIVMKVLELSPHLIEEYLATVCGEDAPLRKEVDQRLEGIKVVGRNTRMFQNLFHQED